MMNDSPVDLVWLACHFHESKALPAAAWLHERGYRVGFNMQIADLRTEVHELTAMASDWPIDVLYFADSMGSI